MLIVKLINWKENGNPRHNTNEISNSNSNFNLKFNSKTQLLNLNLI